MNQITQNVSAQTADTQSTPAQEVPQTVSNTVKISMTKEQATAWLSGVFNTPTTVIPTEQFPELIKANLGLDVPEKFLGTFIMQMLNKPLTSRPRKEKPIEEPKPKREKAIKEIFFQFADSEEPEVVSIKKEKVEAVINDVTENTDTESVEMQVTDTVTQVGTFYEGSLGILDKGGILDLKPEELFGETGVGVDQARFDEIEETESNNNSNAETNDNW